MLVGIRAVIALLDGLGERVDRVAHLLAALVDQAQMVEVVRIVGLDLHCLPHQIARFAQVLPAGERAAEEVEGLRLAIVQGHGLPELLLGLLELTAFHQDAAQAGTVLRLLGVELDRPPERLERGLRLPHPAQQRGVLERQRGVGVELRQRDLHLLAGRGQAALRREGLAHARVGDGVVGILLQRARVQLLRLVPVAERQR